MRKTPKKIFGILGLVLVATMTLVAAALPTPEASAATSVTDTIVVKVLPTSPDVNITYPPDGLVFVSPEHTISFDFAQVDDVVVTLEKEVPGGTPLVYPTLYDGHPAMVAGQDSVGIDLSGPEYGYGVYRIKIRGTVTSAADLSDEDVITFTYGPVTAEIEEDDNGDVYAVLDYDDDSVDLDHFVINVYDGDGNPVPGMTGIIVNRPDKQAKLPFGPDVPDGTYTIKIGAIDKDGELIYETYDTIFKYEAIKVPNTGGLFKSLNIASTDYLITGIIMFFTIGIVGVLFIAKDKRSAKRNTRRK